MKKLFCIVSALTLLFCIAGCGGAGNTQSEVDLTKHATITKPSEDKAASEDSSSLDSEAGTSGEDAAASSNNTNTDGTSQSGGKLSDKTQSRIDAWKEQADKWKEQVDKWKSNVSGKTSQNTGSLKPTAPFSEKNLKGKTITVMRDWEPYVKGKNTAHDNFINWVEKVEKQYGVDIVEKKWKKTLEAQLLSGLPPEGELYLVGSASGGKIPLLAMQGFITPLDDAMKLTGINMTADHFDPVNVSLGNFNGKQWVVGVGFSRVNSLVLYNKKAVSAAGYDIEALMKAKQWNWAKMTEIAKKTTVTGADGNVTRYGIGIDATGVKGMILSNGGHFIHPDSNGKFVSCLGSANTKEAIKQVESWFNTDKVATYTSKNFTDGKVVMSFCGINGITDAGKKMGGDDYGVAYLPMGPKMNKYVSYMSNEYGYVIPSMFSDRAAELLFIASKLHEWPVAGYKEIDEFNDELGRHFHNDAAYGNFKNLYFSNDLMKVWDGSDLAGTSDMNIKYIFDGTIASDTWIDGANTSLNTALSTLASKIKYTGKLK